VKRHFLSLVVFAVLVTALPVFAAVDTWQVDTNHSAAHFSVRHLGISTVRGEFSKVTGTVQYDPADVTKSVVDITIPATTFNTNVEARDRDLRSANWLDVEKFPNLTFKSTKVESAGQGKLKVTGDLTIHGVTKSVVLDVEGPNTVTDPRGNAHMGAGATTKISRKDFGLTANPMAVGDEVQITLDVELAKARPPQ